MPREGRAASCPRAALTLLLVLAFALDVAADVEPVVANTAQVRFVVLHDKVNQGWCTMATSALMAGIPVVSLHYDKSDERVVPLERILAYAESDGLSDKDVIVTFDGDDVVFAGNSPMTFVEAFIRSSPESAEGLDPVAVHEGQYTRDPAMPPVIFGGEVKCALQQVSSGAGCAALYDQMEEMLRTANPEYVSNAGGALSVHRFLSTGSMVARVWAIKVLKEKYDAFTDAKASSSNHRSLRGQSAYGAMYYQQQRRLAQWLVDMPESKGYRPWMGKGRLLVPAEDAPASMVPLGLMGVNTVSDFLFTPHHSKMGVEVCEDYTRPAPLSEALIDDFLKEHPRPRAPAVYACPRRLYELKGIRDKVYPVALHFPGRAAGRRVFDRYRKYLPWVPRTTAEVATLKRLLSSRTLEVWAEGKLTLLPFSEHCASHLDGLLPIAEVNHADHSQSATDTETDN